MRHGKKFNHLSRTTAHRKAMLANMASSLIKHKRVSTTVAKAKALRSYVEPIINKSKEDTTHSRRVVFSHLQDKDTVKELFAVVAGKVAERPGGYTRIIKVGNRAGDNADMCIIELVDFNDNLLKDTSKSSGKSRRSRRGGKKKSDAVQDENTEKVEAKKETSEVKEVKTEAKVSEKAEPKAEVKPESKEEAKAPTEPEAKTDDKAKEEKVDSKIESKPDADDKAEAKSESKEESKKEDNSPSDSKDESDKK
ncbi:50S ribosomal protein L17 [Hyphobacterium sp. CCMP332]|nr:50S ribosomal protein L17 [Hyphobacterium sp. CCMP332]